MKLPMKSKEEREAQWERIAWKISARKGWSLQEAGQYLAERAIGFWLSRTARSFIGAIVREGEVDPYSERAAAYHRMSGVDESGAVKLW